MANSVLELLFRNLRTEINKVVKENEGLRSINHTLTKDNLQLRSDVSRLELIYEKEIKS